MTLDVDDLVGDVEDGFSVGRRRFVKGAAFAVLTVQSLPLTACASGRSPSGGDGAVDGLIVRSGPGAFSHVHDLLIPYSVLEAPPVEGVELRTTRAILHTHTVALTQEELRAVNRGGRVTRKASSHVFVIALARQDQRGPVAAF